MTKPYDIAIIGGGINGCGCAADAALRGLSVILCEKGDLSSQTSSSSSKLIHGGLRYLEQFNFSLVRNALNERQNLLDLAPHLVHPLQFVLPQPQKQRSSWIVRIGLFLYDHLSRQNRLPKSKIISRQQQPDFFKPLIPTIRKGFSYYDCSTDDSRLTITNAIQAKQHGADIFNYTEVTHVEVIDNLWHLTIETQHQPPRTIIAKAVINAAGPWVTGINQLLHIPNHHDLALIKGSHIVLPALYEGDHAYILQHPDNRIVFTIPYHGYTLVGTTDVPCTDMPDNLHISQEEIDYLFNLIALYFRQRPNQDDIITTWSGVRPLLSDPHKSAQTLTRDYLYHFSSAPAPCVTIYGGKITTYRLLAEKVIDQFQAIFPTLPQSTTRITPLPGGQAFNLEKAVESTTSLYCTDSQTLFPDFSPHRMGDTISAKNHEKESANQYINNSRYDSTAFSRFNTYSLQAQQQYPWLDKPVLEHYLQTYGTRMESLLHACRTMDDLGSHFADVLYQREVDFLIAEEWATSVDDVLWRRTKLGLSFDDQAQQRLEAYIKNNNPFQACHRLAERAGTDGVDGSSF